MSRTLPSQPGPVSARRSSAAAGSVPPDGTAACARLLREPLDCSLTPAAALTRLRGERLPFALTGAWAGGGAIVGSDPVRVAADDEDPFGLLDELPPVEGRPAEQAVGGGWFGWLGYRLSARVERVPLAPLRPATLPEFHLAYYDNVLRMDPQGRWWFEALVTGERREALAARRDHLARLLYDRAGRPATGRDDGQGPAARSREPLTLRLSADDAAHHVAAVAECTNRIAAGEIFQANLCVRLDGRFDGTAADLLGAALARVNPPYAAAFDTPRGSVASLSPELFLRRRGREVVTGPIKGTIVRDEDPARAAAALARLTASAKDAAEHVMIVDLMRNDLGRVCEYGSVVAPRVPTAEPHPGLWHLVSRVSGRLRAGIGDGRLLLATFPPGSVTGAPKVQSLKVIAALERHGREAYTGAIGFASPIAGLELNVAIRTLELAGGRLWLGAGGGIVADSDPRRELSEALAKARPIAAAVGGEVVVEAAPDDAG